MAEKGATKPRKLPKQRRSKEMVETILEATARVLVKEGYGEASTNRVAEVAGVSVGSVYQYFPNKESLVAALMDRHLDEMRGIYEGKFAELRNAPLEVAVRGLISASVEAHAVRPELHKVFVEQVPRVGDLGKIAEVGGRIEEELLDLLRRHRQEVEREDSGLAVFLILYGVESTIHAAVIERPEYVKDGRLADELTKLVLGYLSFGQSG